MYNPMNVWSEERFAAEEDRLEAWRKEHWPETVRQQHAQSVSNREAKRQEFRSKFPFTLIVEGSYPEIDNAQRWCWDNFGPRDGRCEWEHQSEYPGCPLVRATEYVQEGSYTDQAGQSHTWKDKCYRKVPAHEHVGVWICYFLGKTGYDYGHEEFFFKKQADRDAFADAVPNIGFGERYI